MAIRIVHVRDRVPGAVYIGRTNGRYKLAGSIWQNPYRIGPDGSREEVIEKYRAYLLSRPDLLARVRELRGKTLSCWCAPARCHGDVLAEFAEEEGVEEHGNI